MLLKFVGQDNSMGLRRGQIYAVTTVSFRNRIVVYWGVNKYCPYSSPQSLAENWSKP